MWQTLIRSLHAPPRPVTNARRETIMLTVIAALVAAADTGLALLDPPTTGALGPHAWLVLQLVVDASLPLLVRFPRTVTVFALAVTLAMLGSDLFAPGLLVPTVSVSPVTAPRAVPIVVTGVMLREDRRFALGAVAAFAIVAGRLWHPTWAITPFGLLGTMVPALAALYFDTRKQLIRSLRDRAEHAEREKYLLAEQARFQERRRLAAEMHDVVTHRLSLIVLHAGALGLTSRDKDVRKASEDIRESGTEALRELRDLVGVLRGGHAEVCAAEPDAVPAPSAPDLDALVEESRSVGIPVELATDGELGQVSPAVARTLHRVVQEALTNVRKHAPGSKVRIDLRYRPQGIAVTVANTAPAHPPDPILAGSGGGTGLAGLRQRVELVGGTLKSGPIDGGGYLLDAILPAYVPTTESRHDPSRPGR